MTFWSHLHGVGLPSGHLSPATTWSPTRAPLPCLMYSSDHAPLRLPTCFSWNQNTPSETKVGIVYDFLFLTQKYLTRFENTKNKEIKNEQTNKPVWLFSGPYQRSWPGPLFPPILIHLFFTCLKGTMWAT